MKSKLLPLFVLVFLGLFTIKINAQVGINTTAPDASSALDIQSTDAGLLIPRMTTAERNAITDPANALLVFDTDLNGYYFNDGTPASPDWTLLLTETRSRDNYVIVKSEDDFPTASGGTITLDPDTLYEINGTVSTASSIDLNGAYLLGRDTSDDIIDYTGSGALFVGSASSNIRNIRLTGSSGTLFNLSSSGSTSVFTAQSVLVTDFSSVGTINGYGLVFFNVFQFVGNTDGITYSNIGNLLLNNIGWQPNNGGAYETFEGTFTSIQKVSGFSNVPSGAVGIDVSSNPTVANGTIDAVVFTGAGDYVNPYTSGTYSGYNFTNDWEVDCVGIPRESDNNATGIIFIERNTTSNNPTVNLANSSQAIGGTTFSNDLFRMGDAANGLTNNVLQYLGKETRQFSVNSSISYETTDGSASTILAFYIVRYNSGGTLLEIPEGVESYAEFNDGRVRNVSVIGTVTMNPGDYIRVFAQLISPTDGSGNGTTSSRDTLRAYSMNLLLF